MLEAKKHREDGLTYVYERNMNLTIVEEQLKKMNSGVKTAFDNGNATLTQRAPTQSLCGAIIIEFTALTLDGEEVSNLIRRVSKNLGTNRRNSEIKWQEGKIGFVTEMIEPSAYVNQTKHLIADLPD